MEAWINKICSFLGEELGITREIPQFCTNLIDDCIEWYANGFEQLLTFNKTRKINDHYYEVIFNLGDWRVNVYFYNGNWTDCKYNVISKEDTELHKMCLALIGTLDSRLKEANDRRTKLGKAPYSGISDWMYEQLRKRNLSYMYPSYYGR